MADTIQHRWLRFKRHIFRPTMRLRTRLTIGGRTGMNRESQHPFATAADTPDEDAARLR